MTFIANLFDSLRPNTRALNALRDSRKGKRCFIVGNGPSLKEMDLSPLAHEDVFVSNLFALHPDLAVIRPEFYCLSDWVHWKGGRFLPEIREALAKLPDTKFFLEITAAPAVKREYKIDALTLRKERIYYLTVDGQRTIWDDQYCRKLEAGGRRATVAWGKTVTLDFCVPLAEFMGYEKMYLIGNDYNWNLDKSEDLAAGYFYDIKKDSRGLLESSTHIEQTRNDEHVKLIFRGFQNIQKSMQSRGRSMFNAGVGGALDVIPRVKYEDLF
ncbi:MAG: hypothetical protein RIF32_09520 [Leptospirales bacterium]